VEISDSKAIVVAFVDAINAQDWHELERLVSEDFVRHSVAAGAPSVCSRADLVMFLRSEYQTFPDAREEILDLFSDGDKVAARHRFRGTQRGSLGAFPATGKVMDSQYIAIYRVHQGRIGEAWAEWDNAAGLKQLGHIGSPP
jgi:steroid delta-isomerase-like uncharacterized protein